MADSRIVLFGATGYTGRLVAERLVADGVRPVLAGRSPERLEALAERLGGLESVHADVLRQNSVFAMVGERDVLVSTVGPFSKWGLPAVRAAIAAGGIYLDCTGEPPFIRRVFEELGAPARRAGATLLTAMGHDFVPGALAGALALEDAGNAAVRVDIGYFATGGGGAMSAGTRESLVGSALQESFVYRNGGIVAARAAARVRSFRVGEAERAAVSVGGAEHFTLPRAYPRLREVNVYLAPPTSAAIVARAVQAGTLAGSLATRVPGVGGALRFAGGRAAGLLPATEAGTTPGGRSYVVAVAYDAGDNALAEVRLEGPDGYAFTAGFLAWAARRAASAGVTGTGALGPIDAFGLDAFVQGCGEAGLVRASAST